MKQYFAIIAMDIKLALRLRAVIFFNRGAADAQISVSWEQLGYPAHLSAEVRDLWAKTDSGRFTGRYGAKVASHGVVMIKVTP